jgi:RimJ/RimL family protein N-acetyltransferase
MNICQQYTASGASIYLRKVSLNDVTDEYVSWYNNDDVIRYLEINELTKEEAIGFILDGESTGSHYIYAMMTKDDDIHIGNVKIGPINLLKNTSDLVATLGNQQYSGQGIGTQAIAIGMTIAFDVYGLRKLEGGIYDRNIASLKAYERAGWAVVGRRIASINIDDSWCDEVLVECYNPKYFDVDSGIVRPKNDS